MNQTLPAYYSELGPFRRVFETGNPILTYHKLGPRPRQTRIKGLYLSGGLFKRQMAELKQAGFESGRLRDAAGPRGTKSIVITFDDGYVNVLRYGIEALAATGFCAIQFLVADLLGRCNEWDVSLGEAPEPMMDSNQVREWLAAGHEIGSHTSTHPYLTKISVTEARQEVVSSKKKLEDLFGREIEHFCYPYGDWNPQVRDLVQEAGYKTACTTIPGVNTSATNRFELQRFTARYPSRSFRNLWRRFMSASDAF